MEAAAYNFWFLARGRLKFKLGDVDGYEKNPSLSMFKSDISQVIYEISLLPCH
jgi:hypothetical protein